MPAAEGDSLVKEIPGSTSVVLETVKREIEAVAGSRLAQVQNISRSSFLFSVRKKEYQVHIIYSERHCSRAVVVVVGDGGCCGNVAVTSVVFVFV